VTAVQQRTIFLGGEGNAWYDRNHAAITKTHDEALHTPSVDPVLRAIHATKPASVLEIGASNGWRLDVMRELWGCTVCGVEPSADAVAAAYPDVDMCVGTADALPFDAASFDCVVFGFCLYLCDRADLPTIVSEADRVLKAGGLLVVYDFAPAIPATRDYHHRPGVTSFKCDHSTLWDGYARVSREDLHDECAVTVLRK
jgi:SAM-dependent methyltransferase